MFFLKDQNAFNPSVGITFSQSDAFNVYRSDNNEGNLNKFIMDSTVLNLVNDRKRR